MAQDQMDVYMKGVVLVYAYKGLGKNEQNLDSFLRFAKQKKITNKFNINTRQEGVLRIWPK